MSPTELWLRLREEVEAYQRRCFDVANGAANALGDKSAAERHRAEMLNRATGAGWVLDKMREMDGTPRSPGKITAY